MEEMSLQVEKRKEKDANNHHLRKEEERLEKL